MSGGKRKKRGWRALTRAGIRPGRSPGHLTADPEASPTAFQVLAYGPEAFEEKDGASLKDVRERLGRWPVVWVNVNGLSDIEHIRGLGEIFGLHRLSLEDIVNHGQRAKAEPYDEYVFLLMHMADLEERAGLEQISLFFGRGFVLTFQERAGDCFDPVRERIREGKGRIRTAGPDYLAYALLDAVVDGYFPVLEKLGDRIETLEQEVMTEPDRTTVARIHQVRNDLLLLRRAIWPHREAVSSLLRGESPFISKDTSYHLRDCYDHAVQILDLVESYREVASGLMDTYLSSLSHRMNEVMKVLTIIATIFIPLSFVAGLYGMNFNPDASPWNMPELSWRWGYPFALGLMAAVAACMLLYFKRRGWLD